MSISETASCHSCGRRAAYTPCDEGETPPQDARCNVLKGWLTVSRWRGKGAVEYYDFCCLDCLLRWAKDQAPQIPDTFLDAFREQ